MSKIVSLHKNGIKTLKYISKVFDVYDIMIT